MNLRDRPYLEVEVVEVKIKKKKEIPEKCVNCHIKEGCSRYRNNYKKLEKAGNWVNGENLDKIKFPCYCRFNYGSERCYGEINSNREKSGDREYTMTNLTKQTKGLSIIYGYNSLKEMMEELRVKILKGKLILFEEE